MPACHNGNEAGVFGKAGHEVAGKPVPNLVTLQLRIGFGVTFKPAVNRAEASRVAPSIVV